MDTITDAVFNSWNLDPWLLTPALVIGVLYARGWSRQHKRAPHRFDFPQLISFFAGVITVLLALVSPLDTFAGWLLTVHMIQHLLLMMVAPALILYGNPYLPLLAGMPRSFVKDGLRPFLASVSLRRCGRFVTHPVVCWTAFVFTTIAWHTPPMYQLALNSPTWHAVEHICFLTTALLFWSPIIQPYPLVPQMPRWSLIPYLFLADFQNTALSAFLIFYERVLYPAYETVPRIASLTVLEDQAAAGAIMWVASSIFFLIPVGLITIEVLSQKKTSLLRKRLVVGQSEIRKRNEGHAVKQRPRRRTAVDLLSLPLVGSVLRWRYFRRSVQAVMFVMAIVVVADGFFGPQVGAMNLAGVLPWTHWRGLSVIALLVVGNVVCMACPFNFVRDLGRRLLPVSWSWPRRLRSKWIAIFLLFIFFWLYEAFGLWDSPRWIAWLIVGYFATALIVDGLFKGASFCKYVCPVGQYQFIQSLISPVEVGVRSLEVCNTCTTHDCLRGNSRQRGCELQLFQPQKTSNMDCTFCLDCVHSCPHENVSLLATLPGTQLVKIERRKRSLRWFRRFDGAALIFLLVFAAFINAGSMIESVQRWEQSLQQTLGRSSFHIVLFVSFLIVLVVVPVMLVAGSVWLEKLSSRRPMSWRESVSTFAQAFVPLGFSMWLAHFSYHLINGALTAVPVVQRAARSAGLSILGKPDWSLSASMINFDWLPSAQLLILGLGFLLTLYIGWRLASSFRLKFARTLGMVAPWAALALVLYAAGVWIIFQPMQMRGMIMDGTTEWCVSQ
jgi:cytochrome c oxidase assembly factor CtaG/ferredoxin